MNNISAIIVTSRIHFIFFLIIFDLMINVDDEALSVKNDIRLNNVIISKPVETSDEII